MEAIGEVIVAVDGCEGMLAPVLAVIKRCVVRWFTMQRTAEDGDRLRYQAHSINVVELKKSRKLKAKAVREDRNKRSQGARAPSAFFLMRLRFHDASSSLCCPPLPPSLHLCVFPHCRNARYLL